MNQPIHNDYWLCIESVVQQCPGKHHHLLSLIRVDLVSPEHMPVTIINAIRIQR